MSEHQAHSRTLQRRVVFLVIALSLLVCWTSVNGLLSQWRLYGEARQVVDSNLLVDDLLQAAQNLAFERGRTNVVLRGSGPVSPENRAFLEERRAAATLHMDAALARLGSNDNPHLARVRKAYGEILAMRRDVDLAMGYHLDQRDASLADRWVRTASGLLRSIADLVSSAALQRIGTTSDFRIFSRIKVAAFQLRDDAGLESSRLASAIASTAPITPVALSEVLQLRGRTQSWWNQLQREIALVGLPPLMAAMHSVQDQFIDGFRPLEDKVLAAGLGGGAYPVNSRDFTGASVPALDSIAALMAVATAETRTYAQNNMRQSQMRMLGHAALFLLSLLLAGATILYVVFRLLRPLRAVQESLNELAAGRADIPFNASPRHDEMGELGRAVIAFRDNLLHRQQMEEGLRHRDRLNQALMNATSDAAFLIDRQGILRAGNQALLDRLNLSMDQVLGRHYTELFPKAAEQARRDVVEKVFRDGIPAHLQDERNHMVLDNRLYPVPGDDGQVHSVAIFSREITQQVLSERRLQKTLEELARSNEELESFAYAASHDLRQPLRMISSFLSLTVRRLGDKLDEETRSFIGFAVDGAARMDQMIIDLLNYSRIGRVDQSWAAVDLNGVLACVRNTLRPVLEEKQATLTVPDSLPTLWAVGSEMERLFQNLVSNALKFHAPDRRPVITLSCRQDGDMWILSLSDNGIGMDADGMKRLFCVFQRLVTREEYEGTGIGLASCRKICQHHHGRIWAESLPGQGSTFHVALPVYTGQE